MGAATAIYVLVVKEYQEWVKVSAVSLDEAEEKAMDLPDVDRVLRSSYEPQ